MAALMVGQLSSCSHCRRTNPTPVSVNRGYYCISCSQLTQVPLVQLGSRPVCAKLLVNATQTRSLDSVVRLSCLSLPPIVLCRRHRQLRQAVLTTTTFEGPFSRENAKAGIEIPGTRRSYHQTPRASVVARVTRSAAGSSTREKYMKEGITRRAFLESKKKLCPSC